MRAVLAKRPVDQKTRLLDFNELDTLLAQSPLSLVDIAGLHIRQNVDASVRNCQPCCNAPHKQFGARDGLVTRAHHA